MDKFLLILSLVLLVPFVVALLRSGDPGKHDPVDVELISSGMDYGTDGNCYPVYIVQANNYDDACRFADNSTPPADGNWEVVHIGRNQWRIGVMLWDVRDLPHSVQVLPTKGYQEMNKIARRYARR